MTMISVTITDKDGSSTTQNFEITPTKEEVLIGRVKGNDVVLPKTNVSKRHSRIIVKEGRVILVDLKSTNGTFVNGQKISAPRPITESDKVFIGDFQLEVKLVDGGASVAPNVAPMPSFGGVPGIGTSHTESGRPLGGLPSLNGVPSVGAVPPGGPGLPSLGGGAPVGPAPSLGNVQPVSPAAPSLGGLPPVGGASPMGPGAGLGVNSGLGVAPAPAPNPGMSQLPIGMGGGLGASPVAPANVSAPHGIGGSMAPLPSVAGATRIPGVPNVQPTGESQNSLKPASEGVIDKSLRASSGSSVERQLGSNVPKAARKEAAAKIVASSSVSATLPEEIIVDDARNPQSEARMKAARIVMDAYLGSIDFQELVNQQYPPEPAVQDNCYTQLANIANANRPQLGNVNVEELLEFLLREVCGLGAIDSLIDDEAVTDFTVYNFETIVVERGGRREISDLQFTSADTLYLAARRILSFQGLTEQDAPAVSEVRLGDGTQIQVVMSPVSVASTCIVVRKTCRKFNALPALVQREVLSNEMAKFLLLCVKARRNILVVGAQGSGRTSILNALGSEIPNGERITTIENSAMMLMPQLYVMSLEAQNSNYQGSDLASLIRSASKLRAERVIVDTIQNASEASAFIGAIYAGAQGSMATISGIGASEGLNNIMRMVNTDNALAGLSQVVKVLDIVLSTRAFSDGRRRIVEISEVAETEDGKLVLVPIFEWKEAGMGKGAFKASGNIPAFYQALERGGVSLDPTIFNS